MKKRGKMDLAFRHSASLSAENDTWNTLRGPGMAAITVSQPLECLMGPPPFSLPFQVLAASSPLWLLPLTHPSTRVVTVLVLLAIFSQLLSNVLSSKQILCSAGSLQFRCSKTVPHFAAVLGNQRASTKVLGWLTCSRFRSCPFP